MSRRKQEPVVLEPVVLEPIVLEPTLVEPKKLKKVRVKKEVVVETKNEPQVVEVAKPKKSSKWITALKEYNSDKSSYIIPKRGTSEYDSVIKLMNGISL